MTPTGIWVVDFEFACRPGGRPEPICIVAYELVSNRLVRVWLVGQVQPKMPFDLYPNDLYVAFFASAEIGCHLALGWPLPERIIDLYAEYRVATNGQLPPGRAGLLAALHWYGLDADVDTARKNEMRQLALRGGPYSPEEQHALLDYCESDVVATRRLWEAMKSRIDVPRAMLRGDYVASVGKMEHAGLPIDVPRLELLASRWHDVRWRLGYMAAARYEDTYSLVGHDAKFDTRKFEHYLRRRGIAWPKTATGRLRLDTETFSTMARSMSGLRSLHEVRKTLSRMRQIGLEVGPDGRNRTLLSPFRSITGRNQPSNSKSIFGAPAWLRCLIKPTPGCALAYVDWSQQEFGIAAALSNDRAMVDAYCSGDPYLSFAIKAGAAPPTATKSTHRDVRETYKVVVLATQYLMGAELLAVQLGIDTARAKALLEQHRRAFPAYWAWSDRVTMTASHRRTMTACLGWSFHLPAVLDRAGAAKLERTVRNWPVQATGAEMLRVAVVLAHRAGVSICAPVHDALLIEALDDQIEEAVDTTRTAMAEASRVVLGGRLTLRADVDQIVRFPHRFSDKRGIDTWCEVHKLLGVDPK